MRVLIATVTAGGGHLAAAAALEEAWRGFRAGDTLDRVDMLRFFSPLHRKLHAEGYVKLVEHAPELWGLVFKKTDTPQLARRLNKLKQLVPSASRQRIQRYFNEFNPDIVLCTHYMPLEILGSFREKRASTSKPPVIGSSSSSSASAKRSEETPRMSSAAKNGAGPLIVSIITDFEAHALWMESCVDLYCVAAEETKARLVARGAPAERVVTTGIPISAKFSSKPDPKAICSTLGLRDDQPIVLVLSGGFGMGPVAEILAELDKVNRPFQTVVVTGRNEELRRELAVVDRKHPTHVLGYASNMHELMTVADLIISKPGGLTSSEALSLGKPLFILNPIPGQEAANSDFLLERGAAAKVNRVEDLPYRLEQLIGSRKLAEMASAAAALGRPAAARQICQAVMTRAGS